jgi:hypothetical protein
MKKGPQVKRVVLFQNLGFLSVIILCVLDELVQLPALLQSGHSFTFLLHLPALEILVILAIWLLVSISTHRILEHLHYLEGFLRVCAWCRRINYQGDWMRLEDFMRQGFDTPTTHGICPECFELQKAAANKARVARESASPAI